MKCTHCGESLSLTDCEKDKVIDLYNCRHDSLVIRCPICYKGTTIKIVTSETDSKVKKDSFGKVLKVRLIRPTHIKRDWDNAIGCECDFCGRSDHCAETEVGERICPSCSTDSYLSDWITYAESLEAVVKEFT